jgi:outer membrane protein OmpA-like peptidoglycan-associated protein
MKRGFAQVAAFTLITALAAFASGQGESALRKDQGPYSQPGILLTLSDSQAEIQIANEPGKTQRTMRFVINSETQREHVAKDQTVVVIYIRDRNQLVAKKLFNVGRTTPQGSATPYGVARNTHSNSAKPLPNPEGIRAGVIDEIEISHGDFAPPKTEEDFESIRSAAGSAAADGEFAKAFSLYKGALSASPTIAWAHRGLADSYLVNGSWGKAADEYEAVTRIDPDDSDAGQLASIARQALTEQQEDVVKANTYSVIRKFKLSWFQTAVEDERDTMLSPVHAMRGLEFARVSTPLLPPQSIPVLVAFPRNQHTLDDKTIRQLREVAASINSSPRPPEWILVEGHTCTCGSAERNLELGKRRADAVRDFLVASGVAHANRIAATSYGSLRPLESPGAPNLPAVVCDRDPIHSENRRVVIQLYFAAADSNPPPPLNVAFLSRPHGAENFVPVADGGQLRTGDEYMIRLNAPKEAYVYVFHRQSDGIWLALAPIETTQTAPPQVAIPVGPNREVYIPSPITGFELVGTAGIEETIIYSRTLPDPGLEALTQRIQSAPNPGFRELRAPSLPALNKPTVMSGPTQKSPNPEEIHDPAAMRGLRHISVEEDWQELPPDPVAYVRINHK